MAEALRKVFNASVAYFTSFGETTYPSGAGARPKKDEKKDEESHRLGQYRVDYSLPTQEELNQPDPELDSLFYQSKLISHNSET
jgi:hypothetical protein